MQQTGERLARERGLSFYTQVDGERISSTCRETVKLVSGKYAVVEHEPEFTLVAWKPVIEKRPTWVWMTFETFQPLRA